MDITISENTFGDTLLVYTHKVDTGEDPFKRDVEVRAIVSKYIPKELAVRALVNMAAVYGEDDD